MNPPEVSMQRVPSRIRPWLLGLVPGALAFFLGAVPAQAALEVGAEATDVTAAEHINIDPVALNELRGRVILLELFSTT